MKHEVDIHVSEERVDKAELTCPFGDASEAVCTLYDAFVEGLSLSLNPDYQFCMKRIEYSSSSICEWKLERGAKGVTRKDSSKDSCTFIKLSFQHKEQHIE